MTGANAGESGVLRRVSVKVRTALLGRIPQGVVANAFAQLVLILPQVTIPSALLFTLGAERAGAWLLALTLSNLLLLADFGVTMSVSAKLLHLKARHEVEEAKRQFTTSLVLVLGFGLGMAGLCSALILALPTSPVAGLASLEPDLVPLLLCLIGASLAQLLTTYFTLLVRADDRYASATYVGSLYGAAEFAVALSLILWGASLLSLAAGLLAIRLVCLAASAQYARQTIGWMRWSDDGLTGARLLDQIRSGAAFSVIPAAQALLLSGPLIILGATANAASVALFSTLRTLTRTGLQAQLVVSNAVMPEYGKAVAQHNMAKAVQLIRRSLIAWTVIGIPFILAMSLIGLPVYELWTHHTVEAPQTLVVIFAVQVTLGALWNVLLNLIYAAGRHAMLVAYLVPGGIVFLPLCYGLSTQLGPFGAILAVIAYDALILAACIRALRRHVADEARRADDTSLALRSSHRPENPADNRSCGATA